MSTEWFYTKDGEQLGPVSSKQLSQLAASGELQPTDLVWKEGAPDWKPASIVKGLFAETTTPPPPVPADSAAATPASPALGEAARGLFSAVTAKAKEFEDKATAAARGLGDKAAEAAKAIEGNQWREPDDGTPANPLLATLQARKRLIVFCIIGLFVFSIGISLLLMLTGVIPGTGYSSYANIDENGHYKSQSALSKGTLNSFNDHPRPVLDAVRDGKQVLELRGMGSLAGSGLQSNNYLILENGKLIGWAGKAIWADKSAGSLIGAKQGEISWTIPRTLKTDESQSKSTYEFTKVSENEFRLRILLQMPDYKTNTSRNVREVQIVMDPEVGEGYWKGSSTTTIKYRGTVADVSDSVDRETGRGSVIPVTLP